MTTALQRLAALLLLAAPAASAQTVIGGLMGQQDADYFGYIVDGQGDVDGDGTNDVLVATYAAAIGGHPDVGLVRIFSGKTHAQILQKTGPSYPDGFGWAAAQVGDVNGDGRGDFVVGINLDATTGNQAGAVRAYSGATGTALWIHFGAMPGDRLGFSVASVGDVNGDGRSDVALGAPFSDVGGDETGSVRVVSGVNGSTLLQLHGTLPGAHFGWRVAGAGDVDADGRGDLAIGVPDDPQEHGRVEVRSGQDGALLFALDGAASGDKLGLTHCGVGDVDGDGRDDVAIGSRWEDAGGHDAGAVRVLSGAGGHVLWEATGDGGADLHGWAVAPAGDVNHDGRPDVLAGAPRYGLSAGGKPCYARLYSGRDGAVIYTLEGNAPDDRFGASLAALGDIDSDGDPDFAIGAWGDATFGGEAGAVWLVSGYSPWLNLGCATPAGGLVLAGHGPLTPGQWVGFTLAAPPGGPAAMLVAGFAMIHAPFHGGVLVPVPSLLVAPLAPGPEGLLAVGKLWPAGVPSGFGFVLQCWAPAPGSPGGLAASNALLGLVP